MACRASNVIAAYLAFSVLSILFLYGLAVGIGHVSPFVPHLGYLGDRPFESTVFTQLMVVKATAFAAVVQIQYVRVSALFPSEIENPPKVRANTASFCIGYVIVMSLFVFACFQEMNAYWVHHLSFIGFLLGSILYFSLQTYILEESKMMRCVLNILMYIAFVGFITGYILSVMKFQKPWQERYYWKWEDGGWLFHVLSAICEWFLIFLFYLYLLTFYFDFQSVMLSKTRMIVIPRNHEE